MQSRLGAFIGPLLTLPMRTIFSSWTRTVDLCKPLNDAFILHWFAD